MEMFDYEKKHLQTLREALAECTVLLKSNGDFPLSAPCKIAAYDDTPVSFKALEEVFRGGAMTGVLPVKL